MKNTIFFLFLFLISITALAQNKVRDTLFLDCFDINGDKHVFSKKFDHIVTSKESDTFYKQAGIECEKLVDSLKKSTFLKNRTRKKTTKNKPTPN